MKAKLSIFVKTNLGWSIKIGLRWSIRMDFTDASKAAKFISLPCSPGQAQFQTTIITTVTPRWHPGELPYS